MDIFAKILNALHFDANIYLHSRFCSPWGLKSDKPGLGSFHVIAYGNCMIKMDGRTDLMLNAGDLVFFPRNLPHRIQNQSQGEDQYTTLICGSYDFGEKENPLLENLPDVIHIPSNDISQHAWFESLLRQIVNEAETGTEGKSLILDRLAEILFIYILRYYVKTTQSQQGLLAGLADIQISKALTSFHNDLSQAWTVELLAKEANMSRTAFANLFAKLVKTTPMQYVMQWRMQCAYNALISSNDSILNIALDHGYQTEASFSKVFKKHFGISPGRTRRNRNG